MQSEPMLLRSSEPNGGQDAYPPDEQSFIPPIDLNEHLTRNRQDTFYLRVHTSCMAGAGIAAGDMLVVDRSLKPRNGTVVIAMLDGELLVRYYEKQRGKVWLAPATPTLATIAVNGAARFSVWGVVTYVVRKI